MVIEGVMVVEEYKGVVVCLNKENGILFAKCTHNVMETDHIIFDDIQTQMDNLDCAVKLENVRDGYGEWTTKAIIDGEEFIYKVLFDDEKEG